MINIREKMKLYLIIFYILFSSIVNVAKPLIYLVKHQTLPAYEIAIEALTSELIATYDIEEIIIKILINFEIFLAELLANHVRNTYRRTKIISVIKKIFIY